MRVIAGVAAALACMAVIARDALASRALSAPAPAASPLGSAPRLPDGAHALGALPGPTPIHATVTLVPRDPAALAAYARDVATAGSPAFHRYLTVSQFAQRFGPASADIGRVRATLSAQGLHPGPAAANRLSIPISASAAQLAGAFHTSFDRYRLPGGQTAYANRTAPSVPADEARVVQGVLGLDSLSRMHPVALRRARPSGTGPTPRDVGQPQVAGAPSACSDASSAAGASANTASQIASANGLDGLYGAGDLGQGQTVALYELQPLSAPDVAAYQSCYATHAAVTVRPVDGGPLSTDTATDEADLDIEDVIGLAPQAAVEVYEGPNDGGSGPYDTLAQIVTDDTAQVISTSWGACEANLGTGDAASEATLFQEAAAQGQTVLAASGDTGADDCGTSGSPSVDDPASQPYVTGVGGTQLASPGAAAGQTVWNSAEGAGGGGVSRLWARPSYQSADAVAPSGITCNAGTACREVPDVSADATPETGYVIHDGGAWHVYGGTSAAAPTWAALIALVNASSPACSKTPIGFANPALYVAAASDFTDVVSGNNSFGSTTGYAAAAGYDLASGLGAPQGTALAAALCPGGATAVSSTTSTTTSSTTTAPPPPTAPPTTTPTSPPAALPTITLTTPAAQSGRVGVRQHLQTAARDSAGLELSYAAAGLPAGLRLDTRSGLISGIPSRPGVRAVTLAATDSAGARAGAAFRWTIAGRPTVRQALLRRARSVLSLTIAAGAHAGAIHRVAITAGARHRAAVIVLRRPSRTARLTIPASQLGLGAGRGRLTVAVTDIAGVRTTLAVEVASG